jgi:hypothetical protein
MVKTMYHYDIKLTSGAVILAALLLSITDSKAAGFTNPAHNPAKLQQSNAHAEPQKCFSIAQPD